MVVLGESLNFMNLIDKKLKIFANIMRATAPNTFEVTDPHMQPNLSIANALVGINILNKVGGYPVVANVFGITVPHNQ